VRLLLRKECVKNFVLTICLHPNYHKETRKNYLGTSSSVNKVSNISFLRYNPEFCDFKSVLVI
jgi:hypothetical protein